MSDFAEPSPESERGDPTPAGMNSARHEVRRVFLAELNRHFRASPWSMIMASLVFPFSTIMAFYFLPGVQVQGILHLQQAGYSGPVIASAAGSGAPAHAGDPAIASAGSGAPAHAGDPAIASAGSGAPAHAGAPAIAAAGSGEPTDPGRPQPDGSAPAGAPSAALSAPQRRALDEFLEQLGEQSLYRLEPVADARAAFDRGEVDLGLVLEAAAPGAPLTIQVYRKHDFLSELFMDHLEAVRERFRAPAIEAVPHALVAVETSSVTRAREARSGLIQRSPVVLLGFAWFFLTVGCVEAFVVEKERRTLELVLSGLRRESVAWGKIGFVVAQACAPQIAAAMAFLLLGFSPWVLASSLLFCLALLPAAVLCFRFYRDLDSAQAAGWRNGVLFMLGFPLIILSDDLVGTWSPFYHVARTLEGPPPFLFYAICLGSIGVWAALSVLWLPRIARRWSL